MDKTIKQLLLKRKKGKLTALESLQLDDWYLKQASKNSAPSPENLDKDLGAVWLGLQKEIEKPSLLRKNTRSNFRIYFSAAAILLIVAGITLFNRKQPLKMETTTELVEHILPGGNKAELILGDGRVIALNDMRLGEIAVAANMQIKKTKSGELVYTTVAQSKSTKEEFNTIRTPKGGQYHVVLPDGTKVWLNAASQMKYPLQFGNKERKVELTGEAYFEVAHNKAQPFKVISGPQTIEVLGTHFNVSAYPDDQLTKTTLLEGSVKVSLPAYNNLSTTLKPNQQSILKNGTALLKTVISMDGEEEIAWKNNLFVFENDNVEDIMKKLSRWYDFDVEYRAKPAINFYGSISKYDDIKKVLRKLELTNQIRFKVEGRRVTVMP